MIVSSIQTSDQVIIPHRSSLQTLTSIFSYLHSQHKFHWRTIVKDRSGFPQTPVKASTFFYPQSKHDIVALTRDNFELESQLESPKRDHEESALECENAYTEVAKIEKRLHIEAIASENDEIKEVNIDIKDKTWIEKPYSCWVGIIK